MRVHTSHSGTPQADHALKGAPGEQSLAQRHPATSGSAREPSGVHAVSRQGTSPGAQPPPHSRPALLPRRPGRRWGALGLWLTWARGPAGLGHYAGAWPAPAGAQSKLNLHLGAPGGRSARRSHRSWLMASSKRGAAASAPRVRAPPPSARAPCKMVFTKLNIGRGARPGRRGAPAGLPEPGPHPDCQGLLLAGPTAPGVRRGLAQGRPGPGVSGAGKRRRGSGLGIPQVDSRLRRLAINLGRSLPFVSPQSWHF